jgi:hypothetical protein
VRNGHDLAFVLIVIIVIVQVNGDALTIFRQSYQGQHATRTDFEAAAAANALCVIQSINKSWSPRFPAG